LAVLEALGDELSLLGIELVQPSQRPGRHSLEHQPQPFDPLAQLHHPSHAHRRIRGLGPACRGLLGERADGGAVSGERWVILAAGGGYLIHREVLIVSHPHPPRHPREHVRARAGRPITVGSQVGAGTVAAIDVCDEQPRLAPRSRQRAVAPARGQGLGRRDHERPLNGAALHPVAGEAVGVLDMVGHVPGRELAHDPAVGLQHHPSRVDVADGPARPVIDADRSVVVAADDPITDRHRHPTIRPLLAQLAGVGAMSPRRVVQPRARLVIAGDHHRLPGAVFGRCRDPLRDRPLYQPPSAHVRDPAFAARQSM
jgi:hypothetical protein